VDGAILLPPSLFGTACSCVLQVFSAYFCYNRGVESVGSARVRQYVHLMPAVGGMLAVLFRGENLHPYHVAGIGLIGTGLWLAR